MVSSNQNGVYFRESVVSIITPTVPSNNEEPDVRQLQQSVQIITPPVPSINEEEDVGEQGRTSVDGI